VLPPTVPVLEGSASDIACPDDFFDAVTVAQVIIAFQLAGLSFTCCTASRPVANGQVIGLNLMRRL
jgi:hypothetical protein